MGKAASMQPFSFVTSMTEDIRKGLFICATFLTIINVVRNYSITNFV